MSATTTATVQVTVTDRFTGTELFTSPADSIHHASTILKREVHTWGGDYRYTRDAKGSDPSEGFHAFDVWKVVDGDLVEVVATAHIQA